MRSPQQTYPPDEFDTVAPSGPRGAHRAPRSRWSRWWPFLMVLVLFPALAFGLVTWLSNWDGLPDALDPGFTTAEEPEAEDTAEEPAAGDDAAGEDTAGEPADEATEEPVPPEPEPEPDLTLGVDVLNATNRSGLAGSAGDTLEGAGFTDVSTGNWGETDPPASVVWYPTPETEVTARAVAAALGIAAVEASGDVEKITAVLADDFGA